METSEGKCEGKEEGSLDCHAFVSFNVENIITEFDVML